MTSKASQHEPAGSGDLLAVGQHAWRLFTSRRVPWVLKMIPILALLYVISPVDFVPDVALGLGQLDDVAILLLSLRLFTQLADKYELGNVADRAGGPSASPHVTTTYRVRED